jgi:hypothetical protein
MSDVQVVGAFLLLTVVAVLVWRWLNGRSPASLYRDEPITLTDAQWRELLLLEVKPRARKPLRPGYTHDQTERRA